MTELTTGQLASELGVTPARISQLVGAGRLAGCFTGEGRARRFDLKKAAAALGKTLDPGQLMGNGAGTRAALKRINEDAESAAPKAETGEGEELPTSDPDRYELARTQKAEEEARRLRRQNAEAEGTLVLASEVERRVNQALTQELAQVDSMLRTGARRIADELGVDYGSARKCLTDVWREHRGQRSAELAASADAAEMTDAETKADF